MPGRRRLPATQEPGRDRGLCRCRRDGDRHHGHDHGGRPAGTAQSFDWDFGDPGSAANRMTTATPIAGHSHVAVGSYSMSCRVRSSDRHCKPRGAAPLTTAVTIAACPNTLTTPAPPSFRCVALLFLHTLLIVCAVIAIVLAIISYFHVGPLPCWIPAIVTSILLRIALAIPCLVPPGNAPPPAGSSSSPLTSGSSRGRGAAYRVATLALTVVAMVANFLRVQVARRERLGLGEMISRVTAAAGIRPRQSCHERARWLNGLSESALK